MPIRAMRTCRFSQTLLRQTRGVFDPLFFFGDIMRSYELHANAKQVSRSSGRSSVAAAAYRSATSLEDDRTGVVHDYTKKQGVEHSRIYVPDNAPDWAQDREKLWNASEGKENRSNSTTAHELEVGFPSEFNVMQRREAGDAISREIMRRYNVGVDISYHKPNKSGDERNYHAHILFTTRGFDENTKDGWERTKFRDLSKDQKDAQGKAYLDPEGNKTTRGKLEILSLREFTANEMNRIAEREKLEVKTEHLSFEKRGIEQEPTKHIGANATEIEREGKQSERGDINRVIQAANDNIKFLEEQRNIIAIANYRALREFDKESQQAATEKRQDEIFEGQRIKILKAAKADWAELKINQKLERHDLEAQLRSTDSREEATHRKRWQEIIDKEEAFKANLEETRDFSWLGSLIYKVQNKQSIQDAINDRELNIRSSEARLQEGIGGLNRSDKYQLKKLGDSHAEQREELRNRIDTSLLEAQEKSQQKAQQEQETALINEALANDEAAARLDGAVSGKTIAQRQKVAEIKTRGDAYRDKEIIQKQEIEDLEKAKESREKESASWLFHNVEEQDNAPIKDDKERNSWLFGEHNRDNDNDLDHGY